ncbi:MAG TPA: hypothetical protein VEX36_11455 [Thermoleophilaceae bacterium]|nr:hypothetical protein [Thermoleophilaceae bacterium]
MCIARKLTMIAMLAIAVTALTTSLAFGQGEEPRLHNQTPRLIVAQEVHAANDLACPMVTPSPPVEPSPLVTAGGCRLHFSGTNFVFGAHLSAGGTEVVIMVCNVEFDARIDSAGEGWMTHQELTPGTTGTCTRKVCGQVTPPTSEGRAWTFYLQETEVAGQGPRESAGMNVCTQALDGTDTRHCNITVPFGQASPHRPRFTANDVPGDSTFFLYCEHTGTFDSEAVLGTTGEGQLEQNVEVRHT